MVTERSVEKQLEKIGFNRHGWGRGEINELHTILLDGEEIYECVNGIYEGGFALLVATDVRVLLIDSKPLNYLTVEDLRFDMINEMDYSHRVIGAQISIATGSKNLRFRSYNQQRLRKLISHVQHSMAEGKKQQSYHQEDQTQHLEMINQQLQAYLVAQQQQFQNLLAEQHNQNETAKSGEPAERRPVAGPQATDSQLEEIYADGLQEVFGKRPAAKESQPQVAAITPSDTTGAPVPTETTGLFGSRQPDLAAMRIAYSKLPMALRNRKFGRPSFHAHSQVQEPVGSTLG